MAVAVTFVLPVRLCVHTPLCHTGVQRTLEEQQRQLEMDAEKSKEELNKEYGLKGLPSMSELKADIIRI